MKHIINKYIQRQYQTILPLTKMFIKYESNKKMKERKTMFGTDLLLIIVSFS